eukprot:1388838-Prymnesium_polylepis.1
MDSDYNLRAATGRLADGQRHSVPAANCLRGELVHSGIPRIEPMLGLRVLPADNAALPLEGEQLTLVAAALVALHVRTLPRPASHPRVCWEGGRHRHDAARVLPHRALGNASQSALPLDASDRYERAGCPSADAFDRSADGHPLPAGAHQLAGA